MQHVYGMLNQPTALFSILVLGTRGDGAPVD